MLFDLQVQIGSHSFTFDRVYGSSGSPSSAMFEECVSPLVDGLFQGYNATVLAYGQVQLYKIFRSPLVESLYHVVSRILVPEFLDMQQTGSGKTYTMGTAVKDGQQSGLIPQVMNALFGKIESLKHQAEFQLRVSFIEVQLIYSFLILCCYL